MTSIWALGFNLAKHLAIRGGYMLGSRFEVKDQVQPCRRDRKQHGTLAWT